MNKNDNDKAKEKARAKKAKQKAKDARKQKRAFKRHVMTYGMLWNLLHIPVTQFFHCKVERVKVDGNYIVMSNHNTDYDFLFLGSSFRKHMYFVISEHTMQHGFASSLLKYFIAPISRLKGATAASTAMNIIRTLKKGANVCIFAEGNRSFNGETCDILPSTGKLAKAAGVSLVTYRLEGGYLTSPRWSHSLRRGKMRGHVVNIYTPDQLKAMSDDEINEAINTDLYEDAYARQQEWSAVYKGKRLAEGLEHILFICPECGGISTITGKGHTFSCDKCGLSGTYDKFGYLNGTTYRTVLDWDRWQQEQLPGIIANAESDDTVLFSDNEINLIAVGDDHKPKVIATGTMKMTRRALSVGEHEFLLDKIESGGLGIYSHSATVFNYDGVHYEIKSERRFCAVKYVRAYNCIMASKTEAPADKEEAQPAAT